MKKVPLAAVVSLLATTAHAEQIRFCLAVPHPYSDNGRQLENGVTEDNWTDDGGDWARGLWTTVALTGGSTLWSGYLDGWDYYVPGNGVDH